MILLHTADWHIGQTFYEHDRRSEHQQFLTWLKEQIHALSVDVLLIAGDIFDSANPSAESQKMLYKFLKTVTAENPNLQIVAIAGNHDSAARLEAPNPLLEEINVTMRGIVKRTNEGEIDCEHLIVPLMQDNEVAAWCLAVPYLRQGEAPNYAQSVREMYQFLYEKISDKTKAIIALGHLHTTGSEISENDRSERTVIGGLECIDPETFSQGIAYTALGHLHRAQRVAGRDNLRYSGAPLPMSFSEKNNRQGVVLIELIGSGLPVRIEPIAFEPPAKLISIPASPKPLPAVLNEINLLPNGVVTGNSPYVEIRVLITEPEPSLRNQIEEALKHKSVRLARIASTTPQHEGKDSIILYEELQTINPMDMAMAIFKRHFGGEEMPDTMKTLLQSVIQEVGQ
jgi:exonuclease SbcD